MGKKRKTICALLAFDLAVYDRSRFALMERVRLAAMHSSIGFSWMETRMPEVSSLYPLHLLSWMELREPHQMHVAAFLDRGEFQFLLRP